MVHVVRRLLSHLKKKTKSTLVLNLKDSEDILSWYKRARCQIAYSVYLLYKTGKIWEHTIRMTLCVYICIKKNFRRVTEMNNTGFNIWGKHKWKLRRWKINLGKRLLTKYFWNILLWNIPWKSITCSKVY